MNPTQKSQYDQLETAKQSLMNTSAGLASGAIKPPTYDVPGVGTLSVEKKNTISNTSNLAPSVTTPPSTGGDAGLYARAGISPYQADIEASRSARKALEGQYASALTQTPEEIAAEQQLRAINQAERGAVTAAEFRAGGTSSFAGGESARISREAAIQRMAASENLAALTGVRQSKVSALATRLGLEDKRFEQLVGLEKEFKSLEKGQREEARQTISDILTFAQGTSYDQLDPESQKQIINAVANTPFTLGQIKQAMERSKVAYEEERAKANAATTDIVKLENGNTVLIDKQTRQVVKNLGGAKVSGAGSGIRSLTPEQQADPFIQKLMATEGGKPLTDTFAQSLNKGLAVLGQIGVLQANIKDTKTGPIVGSFRGANPWDTNAQTIKAQLNAIVPNLARGVYGEVGVLTDSDIKNYAKTLPTLKSPEDVQNAVLGITVDMISKSIKRTLEVNAANGKDVSGFADLYTEMIVTRDSIFAQIPKGTDPEITAELSEFGFKAPGVTSSFLSKIFGD